MTASQSHPEHQDRPQLPIRIHNPNAIAGIIDWPDDVWLGKTVLCIVCEQDIPLEVATAGLIYADGQQAFACRSHMNSRSLWIIAWVNFKKEQQFQDDFPGFDLREFA